jgi:hypothetical protein
MMLQRAPHTVSPIVDLELMRALDRKSYEHQEAKQGEHHLNGSAYVAPAGHQNVHNRDVFEITPRRREAQEAIFSPLD